jgi:hypothetical protein
VAPWESRFSCPIRVVEKQHSSVGYETRIEAAIRSFTNHNSHQSIRPKSMPSPSATILIPPEGKSLFKKTLFIPNWDNLSLPLIVAALQREGIDARLLEENPSSIQRSLRHNAGQCIPLNIIAQNLIDTIEKNGLNPSHTALWLATSKIACNIHLYPAHIKRILASYGKGLEKTGVYVESMSMLDLSIKMPVNTYFAYMFGGYLPKMGGNLRPYENVK